MEIEIIQVILAIVVTTLAHFCWRQKWFSRVEPEHEEMQYLNLVKRVMKHGVYRPDRTGTGTYSVFGETMRFSLRNNTLPLMTTKNTFWRGIVEELLFFISGSTNCKKLSDKGVKIWDENTSRETLDKLGFKDRQEYDLGPGYSFQWRHAGAKYVDMNTDYTGQGVDQLAELIKGIKLNPPGRRHILVSFRVPDVSKMSLPPCHAFAQFYVAKGELSCIMYSRSLDLGLGFAFNLASYSLLTIMIAHLTGLKPGEFIHMIGDCHVYINHLDALKEQIQRKPFPFPKLSINTTRESIDDFTFDDFKLLDYQFHPKLKMKMAV